MNTPFSTLMVTKLYAPRTRAAHVDRPRLRAALDAGAEHRLILVAAAAGFGKTTLLADWSASRGDVAWLSLDPGDDDPTRFLAYLIAAIQTRRPEIGRELLAALQSPQQPSAEQVVAALINQLMTQIERLIVVLDDYHVIENPTIHGAITLLLEHLPPTMTLVLLTRADPPLPLARLRARGELVELRAAELRFSTGESGDFLNETFDFGLSADAVLDLDARTEGWVAGLQLAALAMQSAPEDRSAFIRSFTGSHRFILDYLIEEVLSRQPDDVRRFLLQTAFLRRLNGSLCAAVTDVADGQAMLEKLDKRNLFLVPLDQQRGWYRYHHLFADLLQARLQTEDPTALPELQRRAARWHERSGLPEEAVVYALAAGDFDDAARLITGPAAAVADRGEVITLLDWYRAFPPETISRHRRLSLHFGIAFALNGRWDEAETLLGYVEQNGDAQPDEAILLAFLIASYRRDGAHLAAIEAQAAAVEHPDGLIKLVLGLLASIKGDLRAACRRMDEAQAAAEREGNVALALAALFHRCRFHVYLGDLRETLTLGTEALARVQAIGGASLPMASLAHGALCRVAIEQNALDAAEHHAAEALRLSGLTGFLTGVLSSSTLMQAEIAQARGNTNAAAKLAQASLEAAERYDPPSEVFWLRAYQARLWLAQGRVAEAADWARAAQGQRDQPPSLFYPQTIQRVARARVHLAQRRLDEAVTLLTVLLAEPHDLLTVETLGTLALTRQAQGDSVHALLTLEQALALGEPENRLRAFLDLGAPMAKLLARYCETHADQTFAHTVLSAFPDRLIDAPTEILSERERDILRLIVSGQSNEEIARTLTLAVSTVKWYINALYGKLHVRTRAQAIARAHELHLLAD